MSHRWQGGVKGVWGTRSRRTAWGLSSHLQANAGVFYGGPLLVTAEAFERTAWRVRHLGQVCARKVEVAHGRLVPCTHGRGLPCIGAVQSPGRGRGHRQRSEIWKAGKHFGRAKGAHSLVLVKADLSGQGYFNLCRLQSVPYIGPSHLYLFAGPKSMLARLLLQADWPTCPALGESTCPS